MYCVKCHTEVRGGMLNRSGFLVCFDCIGIAEVLAFQETSFRTRYKDIRQVSNKLQIPAPDILEALEIAELSL